MDIKTELIKAKSASHKLAKLDNDFIREKMMLLADMLEQKTDEILAANEKDLEKLENDDPIYDRVLLDHDRIRGIAESVREIADTPSPIGENLESRELDNGLHLSKVRVPLGVIGIIFEARPNVVIDIFALCFKSQNVCVLKGGSQSEHSNEVLVDIIREVIEGEDFCILLPNDRELVAEFLKMDEYVDVIIPRGSSGLIKFVRENSSIPVIETGAGVVHTYFDETGDLEKGCDIVFNAKTSRPSVCNSLDTLLIHKSRVSDLPALCEKLKEKEVQIFADVISYGVLEGYPFLEPATPESFGTEFLSLKMSVKVVESLNEAILHINTFGSGHSEAIVTENEESAEMFLRRVDAAAVYTNASTRFTDGAIFGLGAEVGISTQKLHARGPMGIKELTSYKWVVRGDGQVR